MYDRSGKKVILSLVSLKTVLGWHKWKLCFFGKALKNTVNYIAALLKRETVQFTHRKVGVDYAHTQMKMEIFTSDRN